MSKEMADLERLTLEEIPYDNASVAINTIKLIEDIDAALQEFADRPVFIDDAREYREANLYAMLSVFEKASNYVKIYTEGLDGTIYSDDYFIICVSSWLNEDSNRRLEIVLKNEPRLDADGFGHIYPLLDNPRQLVIRVVRSKEAKECNINAVVADGMTHKIKEIDAHNGCERIVLNFNNPEASMIVEDAINVLFADDFSYKVVPISYWQTWRTNNVLRIEERDHIKECNTEELIEIVNDIRKHVAAVMKRAA